MPTLVLGVPEAYDNNSRPICIEVARAILKATRAPSNARVVFPGNIGAVAQTGSTVDDQQSDDPVVFANDGEAIYIEMDERPIEDRVLNTAVTYPEHALIFHDPSLDVRIKPVYTPTEVTINFRLKFKDRTAADRWVNSIKTAYSAGRVENLHETSYSYGVPPELLYILVEIHKLREAVAPYGEDLETWMRAHLTKRARTVTNLAGNLDHASLVIAETQTTVLGWFDFSYVPEKPSKQDDGPAYTCGFDYRFQYDKVTDCVMNYPIMVHNQILGSNIRADFMPYRLEDRLAYASYSRFAFNQMTATKPASMSQLEGFAIPEFDDWLPARVLAKTTSIMRVLVEVNPDDPRDVLNLEQLGEYEFSPKIISFFKQEAPFMGVFGKSIFHVGMFIGKYPKQDIPVLIDANLNVRTQYDMSLRDINHMRLSMIYDLTVLDQAAIDRLRRDPEIIQVLIDTLLPGRPMPPIIGGGLIPIRDIKDLTEEILDRDHLYKNALDLRRFTVGLYSIITRKGQANANRPA